MYYVGHTKNMMERLKAHNEGRNVSTKENRPWAIAGVIQKSTKREAYALERKLKNLTKARKQAFILKYCTQEAPSPNKVKSVIMDRTSVS